MPMATVILLPTPPPPLPHTHTHARGRTKFMIADDLRGLLQKNLPLVAQLTIGKVERVGVELRGLS